MIEGMEKDKTKAAPPVAQHCMTAEQFDQHLSALMGRHRDSKRTQALRLVLVEGVTAYEAAKRLQVPASSVTAAVTEARETMRHVVALSFPAVRMPPTRQEKAMQGG